MGGSAGDDQNCEGEYSKERCLAPLWKPQLGDSFGAHVMTDDLHNPGTNLPKLTSKIVPLGNQIRT